MYRTWVGLQDTESGRETGVQGFLKLSVTVLGPGDRQRVHDLAEEMQVRERGRNDNDHIAMLLFFVFFATWLGNVRKLPSLWSLPGLRHTQPVARRDNSDFEISRSSTADFERTWGELYIPDPLPLLPFPSRP